MTRTSPLSLALLLGLGASTPALAQDPASAPDDSWISVSGTVTSTRPDSFRLDYGDGIITVEVDDFDDDYNEAYALLPNDQVTVYGKVDDDLYETRTIEASSVYVQGLGATFFASAIDEEDYASWSVRVPIVIGQVELTGTVTSIDGREFTIANAATAVRVDTATLGYNPLDDHGHQKVDVGDRVRVSGELESASLFDEREIEADWLIHLGS